MSHRPWSQPWPAGGGGGGGAAAWGSITGSLSAQTDLTAALAGKQAAGSYETAGAATAAVSAHEAAPDPHSQYLTAAEAAALLPVAGMATVTVPANALEHTETVSAAGVTAGRIVVAGIAPHLDGDENDAELLDIVALSAAPGSGQITFDIAFSAPTQGAIKLNWSAI